MPKVTNNFDTTTDEGWINELAFQLRLRGATGSEVGNAMAEVETHLADSGERASDAFGDPAAYAATLLPSSRREGLPTYLGSLVSGAGAYFGFSLLVEAIRTWGGQAAVHLGEVVALGLMAVLVGVLTLASSAILGTKKLWGLVLWFAAAFAALILPGILLRQVVGTLPAGAALALALALLAAALLALRRVMAGDPIRDPRTPAVGVPFDADERALASSGRPLEAMKRYRERTGASLGEAKQALDDVAG